MCLRCDMQTQMQTHQQASKQASKEASEATEQENKQAQTRHCNAEAYPERTVQEATAAVITDVGPIWLDWSGNGPNLMAKEWEASGRAGFESPRLGMESARIVVGQKSSRAETPKCQLGITCACLPIGRSRPDIGKHRMKPVIASELAKSTFTLAEIAKTWQQSDDSGSKLKSCPTRVSPRHAGSAMS